LQSFNLLDQATATGSKHPGGCPAISALHSKEVEDHTTALGSGMHLVWCFSDTSLISSFD